MDTHKKMWKYNTPVFECDELNYELLAYAPWSGHRNFAYDLICWLEPENIVELGSHYGCSAFAFAQSVKDKAIDTAMYFIDTWQGDDFTQKYDNDVYTIFAETVKKYYSLQDINMLRMTFDQAINEFEDGSIELLHIDGSHHYKDVKHDFETWLPKVKDTGVILLHDVSSDIVLGDIMGSYKYWQELKNQFEFTVDFDFSWGLGIIFLDGKMYRDFMSSGAKLEKYQRINNALDVEYKDRLRRYYFEMKDKQIYLDDLLDQKEILGSQIKAYENDTAEIKNSYEREIANIKNDYEQERAKTVSDYEKSIEEYDLAIKKYNAEAEKYAETIDSYENRIKEYMSAVDSYEGRIREYESAIESYEGRIDGYEKELEKYASTVAGKDSYIAELENLKEEQRKHIEEIENAYGRTLRCKLGKLKGKLKKQV